MTASLILHEPFTDLIEVAKGNKKGHSIIKIKAERRGINVIDGEADIWDFPDEKNYTLSTFADIDTLSCSNALDSGIVHIKGLDYNWNYVFQSKNVNGQNKYTLDTSLVRLLSIEWGGSSELIGDLYCYVDTPATDGKPIDTAKVRGYITNGNHSTMMCRHTVPKGCTCFMIDYNPNLSKKKESTGEVIYYRKPFGKCVIKEDVRPLITSGTSSLPIKEAPTPIIEKTDIYHRGSVSVDDTDIFITASILQIENQYLHNL